MTYLLLLWLTIPLMVPFVISQFAAPIFVPYSMIVVTLPFFLLIANGIKKIKRKNGKLIILSTIFILSSLNITYYFSEVNKDRWREVARYIDKNAELNDLVLFSDSAAKDGVFNYYSRRTDLTKSAGKDIEAFKNSKRAWFITWSTCGDSTAVIENFKKAYRVVDYQKYSSRYSRKTYFLIEVYLFTKN